MLQEQTREQFHVMYGHRDSWSRTTGAVYDVLFHNIHRPVAARKHDVSRQAIQKFITTNKLKHIERVDMEVSQNYINAEPFEEEQITKY